MRSISPNFLLSLALSTLMPLEAIRQPLVEIRVKLALEC